MPKDVDEYVAKNTQRIRDVDSRFVQVDSNRARDLSFGSNFFEVAVDVELYTRSTGSQIVFGHPDESKGFGRGTFGDDKGEWVLQDGVEASADFTKQGRKAAAEALNGMSGAIAESAIGSGTTPVTTTDTALESELVRTTPLTNRNANALDTTTIYDSTTVPGTPGELGIFDDEGRLLARVTFDTSDVTVGPTDEIRGVVTLTFEGSGNGSSVVTNEGQEALAASMETPEVSVGPTEFAFGSGSTDFTESDTALTSEVIRKSAGRETGRDRIISFTRVSQSDMDSVNVDLSEVGLFDNTGRMIWAATFRAIQSDAPGFNTETTIVVS